jgi:hypothetical protein
MSESSAMTSPESRSTLAQHAVEFRGWLVGQMSAAKAKYDRSIRSSPATWRDYMLLSGLVAEFDRRVPLADLLTSGTPEPAPATCATCKSWKSTDVFSCDEGISVLGNRNPPASFSCKLHVPVSSPPDQEQP